MGDPEIRNEMDTAENHEDPQPQQSTMEADDPPAELQVDPALESGEPEPQEEERTLTDHLNRKLLSSFLSKLDSGAIQFPAGVQGPAVEEEEDEFKD